MYDVVFIIQIYVVTEISYYLLLAIQQYHCRCVHQHPGHILTDRYRCKSLGCLGRYGHSCQCLMCTHHYLELWWYKYCEWRAIANQGIKDHAHELYPKAKKSQTSQWVFNLWVTSAWWAPKGWNLVQIALISNSALLFSCFSVARQHPSLYECYVCMNSLK